MRTHVRAGIAVTALAALLIPFSALAAPTMKSSDDSLVLSAPIEKDAFLSGDSVLLNAAIGGEAFVAGNAVTVNERIGRSGFVAGNTVTVSKGAGYNLFAAGSTVTLDGTYENDVYAAGSVVTILPGTVIKGDLRVASGTVSLAGSVTGDVYVAAKAVTSTATIGGNLVGEIKDLTFEGGSIAGYLRNGSMNQPAGLEKVSIAGATEITAPKHAEHATSPKDMAALVAGIVFLAMFAALATLIGLVLSFGTKRSAAIAASVTGSWASNLVTGAAVLFLVPIVSLALMATIVGWPLAVLLHLVLTVLAMVAASLGVLAVGRWLLSFVRPESKDEIWWQVGVGFIACFIGLIIPVVNGFVALALFVCAYLPTLGYLGRSFVGRLRAVKE